MKQLRPKQITILVLESIKFVNSQPRIFLAAILVSLVSMLGRTINFAPISFLASLLIFGWGYVEVDLLLQAHAKKPIDWRTVPPLVLTYLKKTWPLIAIGLFFLIGVIPLLITLYFAPKFAGGSDTASQQLIVVETIQSIQNLISKTIGLNAFIFIFDFVTTLISLWFVQSMIVFIVEKTKIFTAFKISGRYLAKNLFFFLTIALGITLIGFVSRKFLEIGSPYFMTNIIYLVFSLYLGLAIKATLLRNFLK